MSTGYTYRVKDGTISTLKEYATECAQYILGREFEDGIPDHVEADTRSYSKMLDDNKKELERLSKITDAECEQAAQEEYVDSLQAHLDQMFTQKRGGDHYRSMLHQVKAWEPTEELSSLRFFMISQLEDSLAHDCPRGTSSPVHLTGLEWRKMKIEAANSIIRFCARAMEREIKDTMETNEWLSKFRHAFEDQDNG